MSFASLPSNWCGVRFFLACLAIVTLHLSVGECRAQEPRRLDHSAWEDDFDELSKATPGIVAQFQVGELQFSKNVPAISFGGANGESDDRLPDRPFSVTFTGDVEAKENGQFVFSLYVSGRARLELNGRELLHVSARQSGWYRSEPVELRFGKQELKLTYQSPDSKALENPNRPLKQNVERESAEAAVAFPQLGLFWSGPSFGLEPIASRYFSHSSNEASFSQVQHGLGLARGLRCSACHASPNSTNLIPAPSLTSLAGNLRPSWLVKQLTARQAHSDSGVEQPHQPLFALHPNEAAAVTEALFAGSLPPTDVGMPPDGAEWQKRGKPSADKGQTLFLTKGCIACHAVDGVGSNSGVSQNLFTGGDLTRVGSKRPEAFFIRWLQDPASVNEDHRMPKFSLSDGEVYDLAAYLAALQGAGGENDTEVWGDSAEDNKPQENKTQGIGLIQQHRCAACHRLPNQLTAKLRPIEPSLLSAESNWEAGCLQVPDAGRAIPGFALDDKQLTALKEFLTQPQGQFVSKAEQLLVELNCTGCHQRDDFPGIAQHFPELSTRFPSVAEALASAAPPTLTSVGDKLHDQALDNALAGKAEVLRSWLSVQMPRFDLEESQRERLVEHFISSDRVPVGDLPPEEMASEHGYDAPQNSDRAHELAAGRLVTSEGFGCQSCHQIGSSQPLLVAPNAHGTNLSMLGNRIRKSWFERWVRNPARIVPRMEMPAIQTAAEGVLNGSLDQQLAALWTTLNSRDFEPPKPGPVRVVRNHNLPALEESTCVLTDVIETPGKTYLRPLVFGFSNRHNVLFDLESGRLARWWIGDAARQYTRGKTWFWEPGSSPLVSGIDVLEQLAVRDRSGVLWIPDSPGQVAVDLDSIEHLGQTIQWSGRLHLRAGKQFRSVGIEQTLKAVAGSGFSSTTRLTDVEAAENIRVRLGVGNGMVEEMLDDDEATVVFRSDLDSSNHITLRPTVAGRSYSEGSDVWIEALAASEFAAVEWESVFRSSLTADSFPVLPAVEIPRRSKSLDVVPGFVATRLPLPSQEMPISFAWDTAERFFVGSLKGRVLEAIDKDGDGNEERYQVVGDGLPAPYGLQAGPEGLDVLAKYALIRLSENRVAQETGEVRSVWNSRVIADGWGYTADYHDWAVGLERDTEGNYYLALPCQQDERSEAAAKHRGEALRLIPNPQSSEGRLYRIESLAAGLRFPMGIARRADGALFTSDNQGNFNPFNEINHLRQGKRYGFINRLDRKPGFAPPFESPAINLPHPWTRSVNGICFLETPAAVKLREGNRFGVFEGHLIGCEMNGRSLVRMSLEKVGETFQGAAYLFSRPPTGDEANFEGPIVCRVSPAGELYIGNLHDSGWGGGQNTGSIVRLSPSGDLPVGIAEMRAGSTGFEIEFTQPVDPERARNLKNYTLRSYRRVATAAYGGDDQDSRDETIAEVVVGADDRIAWLELGELREGYVYELNVGDVGLDGATLFPSQAHYTLRKIPE